MKNLKIHVCNEAESIEAQELFFRLGAKWSAGGKNIMNYCHDYLYLHDSMEIKHGNAYFVFKESINKEVTIQELRKIVAEHEREDQETDAVKSKPKNPKVWAWDEDVTKAFETYLLAELDGMKDGLNYLVVVEFEVPKFEKKEVFYTDLYKNISYTNPNENKEIEELINKYGKKTILNYINK